MSRRKELPGFGWRWARAVPVARCAEATSTIEQEACRVSGLPLEEIQLEVTELSEDQDNAWKGTRDYERMTPEQRRLLWTVRRWSVHLDRSPDWFSGKAAAVALVERVTGVSM